jgi:hypothetical protein
VAALDAQSKMGDNTSLSPRPRRARSRSHHPVAQIRHKRIDDPLTRLARTIDWRRQALNNALTNGLAITPEPRVIAETVSPWR